MKGICCSKVSLSVEGIGLNNVVGVFSRSRAVSFNQPQVMSEAGSFSLVSSGAVSEAVVWGNDGVVYLVVFVYLLRNLIWIYRDLI